MADVRVVDYEPRWRGDFGRLNFEWIERWFTIEPLDEAILSDPETHVLKGGGLILMAVSDDDTAIGTVALKHHGDAVYELSKMAVEPGHRGAGIGRVLLDAAVDRYRALGGTRLFLESHSKLETALQLYETSGFEHRPAPPSPYARADVYMVWQEPNERNERTTQ